MKRKKWFWEILWSKKGQQNSVTNGRQGCIGERGIKMGTLFHWISIGHWSTFHRQDVSSVSEPCQCIFPLTYISFSNNPVCVHFQAFLYCIPMWDVTSSTCWEQTESLTKTRPLYQWSVISWHICLSVKVHWVRYKEVTSKKPKMMIDR